MQKPKTENKDFKVNKPDTVICNATLNMLIIYIYITYENS